MGKITVYCLLSGCTPEIPDSLFNIFAYEDTEEEPGPIVLKAVGALVYDEEEQGPEDMTVISAFDEDDEPAMTSDNNITRDEALRIPDSSLRVISHCHMGDNWEWGFVEHQDYDSEYFLVSYGTNVMVQTASLHILSLATAGRMTPERVWRLVIRQRYSMSRGGYGLDGIDYGEIHNARDEDPLLVPSLSLDAIIKLESLGDVELVKKAIIDDGKFWVWMRPDRFPLNSTPSDDLAVPTILEPPSTSTPLSKIEQLPVKVLLQISTLLPLPSLLDFLSASRQLRSRHLGFESDRDALARTWIQTTGVWYLPVPYDKLSSDVGDAVIGWAYLRRCLQSGSMRNRRRIWGVVEQIEVLADETERTKPTPWGILPWD